MKKRIQIPDDNKDAAVVFLTTFHNDLQKRLKEKQDEDKVSSLSFKFAKDFTEVLSRCFGTDKVQAESVYMQYMLHKGSVHIAKTRWKTLEDFVKYQGRVGAFLVEYCNKIWYVQAQVKTTTGIKIQSERTSCISDIVSSNNIRVRFRHPLKVMPQSDVPMPKSDTCGHTFPKNIETKMDISSRLNSSPEAKSSNANEKWTLKRSRVEFKVSPRTSPYCKDKSMISKLKTTSCSSKMSTATPNRKSTLAEIMEEEEKMRERRNRKDNWLQSGIVVRIVTDKYGRQNNRKRCRVVGLLSPYTGVGHVLATDAIIAVDQKHLRTCLPEVGGQVRIVNGAYRDEKGVVEKVKLSNGMDIECMVRITGSPLSDYVKRTADALTIDDRGSLSVKVCVKLSKR